MRTLWVAINAVLERKFITLNAMLENRRILSH